METENTDKPRVSGWIIALRIMLFILTPVVLLVLLAFIGSSIEAISEKTGAVYMRAEPILFIYIPLVVVAWIVLANRWSGAKKLAREIAVISTVITVGFLGFTTTLETINTKPIAYTADSFKVPSGYERIYEGNENQLNPAPSGIIPCIDIMGNGCPHVNRAWLIPQNEVLTDKQINKILQDSGWTDVKPLPADPTAGASKIIYEANGNVNGYKASVSIVELYNGNALRIYLRPASTNR